MAMCGRLAPHCERVVISYIDLYRGMKRTGISEVSESDKAALTPHLARVARERGISRGRLLRVGAVGIRSRSIELH